MPKFYYKAKKGPSEVIEGEIDADTKLSAVNKLNSMGYFPITIAEKEIVPDKKRFIISERSGKIRVKEIALFSRQLADLMDGGLTLIKALDVLGQQAEHPSLKKITLEIIDEISGGSTFSDALKKHPSVFQDLHINMIKAGETGGSLNQVLNRIADLCEKEDDIRSKIRAAAVYPIFLSLMGIITIFVLLTFVIPKLLPLFGDMGGRLPWPTKLLLFISAVVVHFWWMIAAVILIAVFIYKRKIKTLEGKTALDNFKLNLPVAGKLIKNAEISRFARTLGTLLTNGVPVLQSLKIVRETMENEIIRTEVTRAGEEISKGSQLGESLKKCAVFPPFAANMISVGEQGGTLEKSLLKIADSYDKEIDRQIKSLTVILEPAMILGIGLLIGFIVIAMLLPIFEINLAVQ